MFIVNVDTRDFSFISVAIKGLGGVIVRTISRLSLKNSWRRK